MRAEGVKNPENFAGVICTCHAPLGLRRPATTNHHENREGMKGEVVIGLEFRLLSVLDSTLIYLGTHLEFSELSKRRRGR